MAETLTVLVTGVGGGGHGEQILKALRLSSLPLRVVGTDVSANSAGLQHVDEALVVPPAGDGAYIDTILDLAKTRGACAVFHGSEPELRALSRERERFRGAGVFLPLNPATTIDLCADKARFFDQIKEWGFTMPRTADLADGAACREIPFPWVLKPSRDSGGSRDVHLVQSESEVEAYRSLLDEDRVFVVQEYVGTTESEFTVGVLHGPDGSFWNSIGVRKAIGSALSNRLVAPNRTGRAELGPVLAISNGISQGEVGSFPEVTGPCEELAAKLGATAPINVQCRVHRGDVHVFEVNPRFSGTTSVRALAGYNEPEWLLRAGVLGETPEIRFPYREGWVARGLSETWIDGGRM